MRPLILRLEGFQGYLEPTTIDLTSITSAAIHGPVGSGKSSIFDAIVYALYGVSRTSTKDGVIHTHAKSMKVEMDFALGEGTYRVRRTRTTTGSAKTYLWHLVPEEDPVVIGDGDGRTGATDAALAELFPLSYEAFCASVLVEQGNSGSFINAKPAERHALMSDILNLDVYKKVNEKARTQARKHKAELARLDTLLEGKDAAEAEAATKAEVAQQAREEAEAAHTKAADLAAEAEAATRAAAEAEAELEAATAANAAGATAIAEAKDSAQEAQVAVRTIEAEIQSTTSRISDGRTWVATQQQMIQRTGDNLTRRLEQARASAPDTAGVTATITALTEEQAALTQQQAALTSQLESLTQLEQQARATVQSHTQAREGLAAQWKEENQRLKQLTAGDNGSTCHACGQRVDDVLAQRMMADLRQQLTQLEAEGKERAAAANTATEAVEAITAQVPVLTAQRDTTQGRLQQISGELATAQATQAQAAQVAGQIQGLEAELAAHQEGTSEAHTELAKNIQTLAGLEATLKELEGSLTSARTQHEAAQADLTQTLEAHPLIDLTDLKATATTAQEAAQAAQEAAQEAKLQQVRIQAAEQAARAAADEASADLKKYDQTAAARKKVRLALTVEENTVKMTSPTGVPQMIMNSAIENMNIYLHQYLQEISGNVLTANLTTTLDTKSGGSKNEINVQVTGADGKPRLYESFSGGQKFLTDFALHLTFARILADQRGAIVDFFAVDEGWNSLEGEEKTSVLRSVQGMSDRYSLVLTVTHDDDVVNSMPQQIKVELTGGTSTVTMKK